MVIDMKRHHNSFVVLLASILMLSGCNKEEPAIVLVYPNDTVWVQRFEINGQPDFSYCYGFYDTITGNLPPENGNYAVELFAEWAPRRRNKKVFLRFFR